MNRRRQPHRIPPPLSHGAESLDAEIVIHEFPEDVGLCLWKTVRTVRLWSELPEEDRHEAFGRDAFAIRMERLGQLSVDPDVRELMETAATVLRPKEVHLEAVVTACRLIAAWADKQGALGTALEFTQVAAMLTPTDAELVLSVARLARRRAEYARAESWYRQAIAVARRTHDWISLTGSHLGLGATFLLRGNHASARHTLIRGVRAAERHSLREERALLSHQLAVVAMRMQRAADVVRYGRGAVDAYGADHPRLPGLAVELGTFWTRTGHLAEASRLLLGASPDTLEPAQRLSRAASLVRGFAALGDLDRYDVAWSEAAALLDDAAVTREADGALLDLIRGAVTVGDDDRAWEIVERAGKRGEGRDDARQHIEAEAFLADLIARRAELRETPKKLSKDGRRLAEDLAAGSLVVVDVS